MELKIFENGVQSHNQVIHRALLKNGLYVMHEKGYSYTVGMKNIGSPDLILFGQSSEIADEMFQVIFQAVQMGLLVLDQVKSIDHIFEPQPQLKHFSDMEKRRHFFAARTYYGSWDFNVLNVSMDFH